MILHIYQAYLSMGAKVITAMHARKGRAGDEAIVRDQVTLLCLFPLLLLFIYACINTNLLFPMFGCS